MQVSSQIRDRFPLQEAFIISDAFGYSREAMAELLGGALQSRSNVNVSVKVENNVAGAEASATVRRDSAGNLDLNIVIEEVETKMARNIGRGEGLASTLERRYGLNPAAGSYR